MTEKLKVEQAVYRISEILFERIFIYLFDDDDPPRYSSHLRENRIRIWGVV